jgi:MFS family permease
MGRREDFVPGKMTLATLLMASTVILMGAAAVAPALEPISRAFPEISPWGISLTVTLPALAVAITGFGVGYLADRFGLVKVFVCSLAVFVAAGVSGYFMNSFGTMLVGRFILGIGIAGISLAVGGLIAGYYSGMNRAKVIGYQSAAMGIGCLFLETAGGGLADMGWREPFLIYLIGVPIIISAFISVRRPVRPDGGHGELPQPTGGKRDIAVCYLAIFLAMFMMFSLPTNMPFQVTQLGSTLVVCGLLLGILGVSQAVCSLVYSRSSNKLSDMSAYAVSFALIGIGCCILVVPHIISAGFAMIFVGVGMGIVCPTVIGRLVSISGFGNSGKIMGGYSAAFNMGVFCSSLIITPVIGVLGSYGNAFFAVGIAALVACAAFACGRHAAPHGKRVDFRQED